MANRLAFLEHTADVGIDVVAEDLTGLFRTAAFGMFELLMGGEDSPHHHDSPRPDPTEAPGIRHFELRAMDAASLLVDWLRELLFMHETDGLCITGIEFRVLTDQELDATVQCVPYHGQPVREIKGVTYHQLVVEREDSAWHARVIFDV